jgi:Na+-driven multidrug efflux pump
MVSGAIFNIIFDPIFLYVFDMGIFGIALATILGQMLTAIIAAYYMIKNFKTVKLERKHFKPSKIHFIKICSLGMAAFFNQIAMFTVQVTLNNILKHYGAMSPYGSDIPLACVGSLSKINFLYMSFVLGIAQGCQPIYGFNYGGKNYRRVKECYRLATSIGSIISVCALVIFQLFPRQLASIFGSGSELYFEFATKYIRIFMAATFINGLQPITSNFFTALGKASTGIFISLTRQVIFLLPLVIILPIFLGIDGVLFAGPIADIISGIVALSLVHREFSSPDFKGAPVAP